MEDLKQAIVNYETYQNLAQELYQLKDGPEKTEKMKEYVQKLNRYKEALAVMYAHGFHKEKMEDEIADFKQRWRHVESNLKEATQHYDETRAS